MSQPDLETNDADVEADSDDDSTVVADIITRLNRQVERINSLEAEIDHKAGKIENLEETVDRQAALVEAVRKQNATLKRLLAGDEETYDSWDPATLTRSTTASSNSRRPSPTTTTVLS